MVSTVVWLIQTLVDMITTPTSLGECVMPKLFRAARTRLPMFADRPIFRGPR